MLHAHDLLVAAVFDRNGRGRSGEREGGGGAEGGRNILTAMRVTGSRLGGHRIL